MAVKYLWSTGETTETIDVNPSVTTTYTLQVTDESGEVATTSLTVEVSTAMYVPIVDDEQLIKCGLIIPSDASVTYEYNTDVLQSYDGNEDRIALRESPRISFDYSYFSTDYVMVNNAINALNSIGNTNRVYAPNWLNYVKCDEISYTKNKVTVPMYHEFVVGQLALIFVPNFSDNKVKYAITNVVQSTSTSITLDKSNIAQDFINCYVLPLFSTFIDDTPKYITSNCLNHKNEIKFIVGDAVYKGFSDYDKKYLGYDVLGDFYTTSSSLTFDKEQEFVENDYNIGRFDRYTYQEQVFNKLSLDLMCNMEEMYYMRNFLKRRYGMCNSFFLPSNVVEVSKFSNELLGETGTNVLCFKYNNHDYNTRPFIAIMANNSYKYYRVLNAEIVSNNNIDYYKITLDRDLDTSIKDINYISTLYLVRLDKDKVTWEVVGYGDSQYFKTSISFVECVYTPYTDIFDYDVLYVGKVEDKNTLILSHFNGNLTNESEKFSQYKPTVNSGTPLYVVGKFGTGLQALDSNFDMNFFTEKEICEEDTVFSDHDWTLEFWIKTPNLTSDDSDKCESINGDYIFVNYAYNSLNVVFNNDYLDSTTCFTITEYIGNLNNNWHHIAVSHKVNTNEIFVFCDGLINGVINTTYDFFKLENTFNVNIKHNTQIIVDDLRLVFDKCLYTNNFEPPIAPLELGAFNVNTTTIADNATLFLDHTCGKSNYLISASIYNYAIYSYRRYFDLQYYGNYNDSRRQYTTVPKGVFFDKSLVIDDMLYFYYYKDSELTSLTEAMCCDFTIEFFVNVKSEMLSSTKYITLFNNMFKNKNNNNLNAMLLLEEGNTDRFGYQISNDYEVIAEMTGLYSYNKWLHVAITFDALNATAKLYLDGLVVYTFTDCKQPCISGYNYNIINKCYGKAFICELRVVRKMLYTKNFTPNITTKPTLEYNTVDCMLLKNDNGFYIGNIFEENGDLLTYLWSTGETTNAIIKTLESKEVITCVVTNQSKGTSVNLFYRG